MTDQQLQDMIRFKMIFWFIVGLISFCGILSIIVLLLDPTKIDIIITFWLTNAAGGAIGYLIGSSVTKSSLPVPITSKTNGITTADISATITTTPTDQTKTDPEEGLTTVIAPTESTTITKS